MKSFYRKYIKSNKLTPLSVSGMVLGMFTFMFIYLYVFTEANYDQFLKNSKNIYHLTLKIKRNGEDLLYSNTPKLLAEEVYNEVPGVKYWATFTSIYETAVLKQDEKKYLNPEILYVNPGFFNVFNYTCLQGDLSNALQDKGTAVITESAALKYFGTTDVVGREYELLHNDLDNLLITVQAVIADPPENSNIQFEIAGNIEDYIGLIGERFLNWYFKISQSYIELDEGANPETVLALMDEVVDKKMNNPEIPTADIVHIGMERIREKHFAKDYTLQHRSERFINKNSLVILFSVGIITLLISWLNYINFMIFQTGKHLREVCIRKISGSGRMRIFWLLLKDSLLLSSFPIILSILLFKTVAPWLYRYFNFNADNIDVNSLFFWSCMVTLFVIGSALASVFPLLRLTSVRPVQLLKNAKSNRKGFKSNAQVFTVIQFSLSIIMLIGIFVINKQMIFVHNQKLGFEKENLISLASPVTSNLNEYENKLKLFKSEALKNPDILSISATSAIPGARLSTMDFGLRDKRETVNKRLLISADEDYFKTLGVKIIAGKNFSSNPELRQREIIINEALSEKLGFEKPADAVGALVNYNSGYIAGVVEDYHHFSLHQGIKPLGYQDAADWFSSILVRINSKNINKDIEQLSLLWDNIFLNTPFKYSFVDEEFKQQYANESRMIKVTFIFTIIAILITILGVIGTSLNIADMRTKEIGIHKVNGARVAEVMALLNTDYIKAIFMAFLLAGPVAYIVMKKWLANFAYKTDMSWWIFALSGVIALSIALLTVSIQSWRAATRNPVEALRYE